MKTVIQAWTHNFIIDKFHVNKYNHLNETNFYFGLGDLIRSTLKLYKLSKQMGFTFIVDIQLHPISEFLKADKHPYSEYVLENKNNVKYVCYGGVEDYINEQNDNEIILILTNDFADEDIDDESKQIIKNIFVPNYKFQNFINLKFSKIPFEKWNIFHYRINDSEFLNKQEEYDFNLYIEYLKENKEENDILITDTKKLKNYIFNHDDIFMFDTKICHLGLSSNSDEIRDTLFELFLIIHSIKIKTYSKIHFISGFVKWISKIYNIPIHNLHP